MAGSLHLLKLCVGADSLADLAQWQTHRLAEAMPKGEPAEILHVTRQTPKRDAALLDGGSLYWVIKGQIAARQKLLALRPVIREGRPHCALVLDPELVLTEPRAHRPFQGWRYFEAKDAPPDLTRSRGAGLPDDLRAELTGLGLL